MEAVNCSECKRELWHEKQFAHSTESKQKSIICNRCFKDSPFRYYVERNNRLREIGFSSYKEYTASQLWQSIRKIVLERDGHRCRCCPNAATEVHHQSYEIEVLCGVKLDGLVSVCRKCHEAAEFKNGKKQDFLDVRRKMRKSITKPRFAYAGINKHV